MYWGMAPNTLVFVQVSICPRQIEKDKHNLRSTKQIANIHWITKKAKRAEKLIYFLLYYLCQSL